MQGFSGARLFKTISPKRSRGIVRTTLSVIAVALVTLSQGCNGTVGVHGIPGHVLDEARVANRPRQ